MIPILFLILLILPPAAWTATDAPDTDSNIGARLLSHIRYLADDAREGRGIGTAGLDSAAEYIAGQFEESGLKPLFDGDWFQNFPMAWGAEILPGCSLSSGEVSLVVGEDAQPYGFSGEGEIEGPPIFAGYGITAKEFDYDDYAKVDVKGAIVVVLEGSPAENKPDSRFGGTMRTDYSYLRTKVLNAKVHGAAGMIIVKGPETDPEEINTLPVLREDEPYKDAGIPVMFVTGRGLKKLLPELETAKLQRSIDLNEAPRSVPAGREPVKMTVRIKRNSVPVKNVGAYLPGDDRVLVVGAHYDHLGYGQAGTTEPGVHEVHNGADDNASGVAEVLELARYFAANGSPGPTIWFVAFTGEEVGLVGSAYFVEHPPAPLEKVFFMLNLDMVGRMQNNRLTGLGVLSATGLREIAEKANETVRLDLALAGDGYGASDQTSFYSHNIPVLHLFTDPHFDYHSPRDDVDRINREGMVKVFDYCRAFLREVSTPGVTLAYKPAEPPKKSASGEKGSRPSLGTIPDFAQPDSLRGVRIQGTRPGSPADLAGLKQGDILVKMGDIVLDNIYDFVFALDSHKPGDKVAIEYLREGKKYETEAVLGGASKRK